jgi:uncharacterized protein (TIGR02246 family)
VTIHSILALAASAAIATACAARPQAPAAAAHDIALERASSDFFAAVAARDPDRTAGHFAEDAVIHAADMPAVSGRAAIRTFYGNVFRFLGDTRSTAGTTRLAASGDMAYQTGRTTNVFQGEGGPVEFAGKYVLVWERREGEWRIAVYALSSDQRPAAR